MFAPSNDSCSCGYVKIGVVSLAYSLPSPLLAEVHVSSARSNRSLAARRGRPYDKGRGFACADALGGGVDIGLHPGVVPNRLRCAILRWFGAQIGKGVLIRHRVTVQWPWKLSIGDNSWIGTGTRAVQPRRHRHRFGRVHFSNTCSCAQAVTTAPRRPSSSTTGRSSSRTAHGCAPAALSFAVSPSAPTR